MTPGSVPMPALGLGLADLPPARPGLSGFAPRLRYTKWRRQLRLAVGGHASRTGPPTPKDVRAGPRVMQSQADQVLRGFASQATDLTESAEEIWR